VEAYIVGLSNTEQLGIRRTTNDRSNWPLAWQVSGSSSLLSPQSLSPSHSQCSLIQRRLPPGHGTEPGRHVRAATYAAQWQCKVTLIITAI